eukprot:768087-Hanusia_phi.AAC.2
MNSLRTRINKVILSSPLFSSSPSLKILLCPALPSPALFPLLLSSPLVPLSTSGLLPSLRRARSMSNLVGYANVREQQKHAFTRGPALGRAEGRTAQTKTSPGSQVPGSKPKKTKSMTVDEIMKKLRHLISIIGKTEWNKHIRWKANLLACSQALQVLRHGQGWDHHLRRAHEIHESSFGAQKFQRERLMLFWNAMAQSLDISDAVSLKDLNAFLQKDEIDAYEVKRGHANRSPPRAAMKSVPQTKVRRGGEERACEHEPVLPQIEYGDTREPLAKNASSPTGMGRNDDKLLSSMSK